MDETSRRVILARRQRLVVAALAALSCSPDASQKARDPASARGGATEPTRAREPGSRLQQPPGPDAPWASDGGAEPVEPVSPIVDSGVMPGPSYDRDGDGVPDALDRCPDVAGVDAVDTTRAGCPARPCLSMVPPSEIRITAKIQFESGRSDPMPSARPILDEIARAMDQNPELELEIVGHSDATEPDELGMRRARAVRDALSARGISPPRLEASGEGSRRPIATNSTSEGRAKNRRVEFVTRGPRRPLGSP